MSALQCTALECTAVENTNESLIWDTTGDLCECRVLDLKIVKSLIELDFYFLFFVYSLTSTFTSFC